MFRLVCRRLLNNNKSNEIVKFSTNSCLYSFQGVKSNKIMNKLLNHSKSKKKKFYVFSGNEVPNYLASVSSPSKKGSKRIDALNKVFMRNISDLMSTGELSECLTGQVIQISRVKITKTFNQINVHWLADGTEEDDKIQKLLSGIAPKLRHELSQLRVMGMVPKIEFVKDVSYLKYMIVENILKTADMGDDYEPSPLTNDWKSDSLAVSNMSDDEEAKGNDSDNTTEISLPPMRMDTFGLKHDSIMKKIIISVNKAKASHRRDSSVDLLHNDANEFSDTSVSMNSKEKRKLFNDFIKKKKIELKKSCKEKNYRPEMILLDEEIENNDFIHEDDSEDFDRNYSFLEDSYTKN